MMHSTVDYLMSIRLVLHFYVNVSADLVFPQFCRPMFTNSSQGKFFVKMISLSLSLLDNEPQFVETMTKLTEKHNEIGSSWKLYLLHFHVFLGVRSSEYGIVGEVLLWTLRYCLGMAYTNDVHQAWVRIVSRMLRVMIPCAVAFEMQNNSAQEARLSAFSASKSLSSSPVHLQRKQHATDLRASIATATDFMYASDYTTTSPSLGLSLDPVSNLPPVSHASRSMVALVGELIQEEKSR